MQLMKNNKGFTLIELLGVIVVLTLILTIAIPSITSTYEKNKKRIDEQKKEVILSAAEIYANRYKKEFEYDAFLNGTCGIPIDVLLEKELITPDELLSNDNKTNLSIPATIIYNKNEGVFEFADKIICYNTYG